MRGPALSLLIAVSAGSACATASSIPVDTSDCVRVEIRNNYSALHSVEAFVVTPGAPRHRLGNVRPGSRRAFMFRPSNGMVPHQLYVRFLGKLDWEIYSKEFAPVPEQVLIWDLGTNHLRRDERSEDESDVPCR